VHGGSISAGGWKVSAKERRYLQEKGNINGREKESTE